MNETTSSFKDRISSLLAEKGYVVEAQDEQILRIRESESGLQITGVLEENILYCSLVCLTAPAAAVTAEVMRKMLAHDNGISTSSFRLYPAGGDTLSITLSNFCTLQNMGDEDEDDILSCIQYLLVDVMAARQVIGELASSANS